MFLPLFLLTLLFVAIGVAAIDYVLFDIMIAEYDLKQDHQ